MSQIYAMAQSLIGLGEVSRWRGNHDKAYGSYQQALQLARDKGERCLQAEALNGAGEALLATGHHQDARTCLTEALMLAEQTGYRYQQARAHRALAAACHAAGQLEHASKHWQHALDICTDLRVPEAAQMRTSAVTAFQ